MAKTESFVEKVVHGVERRIEEWREEDRRRRIEVEANRSRLWEEAVERERLLAEIVREEEERDLSPGDAAKEKRVVFVMHSGGAVEALREFADDGARLAEVIPGYGKHDRESRLEGSWLVFEKT